MQCENQTLSVAEIINLVESGAEVSLPCTNIKEADDLRNNICSRLYRQRKVSQSITDIAYESVSTKILPSEDNSCVMLTVKLHPKDFAKYQCIVKRG